MSCTNSELLAAFSEGRLNPAERDAVLDHAATCDDCRHALLILSAPAQTATARSLRPATRTSWIPWAAAAAFALSVAAFLFFGSSTPDSSLTVKRTPPPVTPD